jgi:hypothetical protein
MTDCAASLEPKSGKRRSDNRSIDGHTALYLKALCTEPVEPPPREAGYDRIGEAPCPPRRAGGAKTPAVEVLAPLGDQRLDSARRESPKREISVPPPPPAPCSMTAGETLRVSSLRAWLVLRSSCFSSGSADAAPMMGSEEEGGDIKAARSASGVAPVSPLSPAPGHPRREVRPHGAMAEGADLVAIDATSVPS